MRVFALSSLVGVLGLAGLALAQEDLIVDPWAQPPSLDRAGSRSVADGTSLPPLPSEGTPLWAEGWSDPPARVLAQPLPPRAVARAAVPASPEPSQPVASIAWAKPMDVIVQPWRQPTRKPVKRDFAIVEPWLE